MVQANKWLSKVSRIYQRCNITDNFYKQIKNYYYYYYIVIILLIMVYNIQSECWRIVLQIYHDKVVKTVIMELCKMQQLCG